MTNRPLTVAEHTAASPTDPTEGAVMRAVTNTLTVQDDRERWAAATEGSWHLDPEPHTDPDLVRTMIGGWRHYIGVLRFGESAQDEANRRFVFLAHDSTRRLLQEHDRMRERIAELEELVAPGDERPGAIRQGPGAVQAVLQDTGAPDRWLALDGSGWHARLTDAEVAAWRETEGAGPEAQCPDIHHGLTRPHTTDECPRV